MKVKELRIGNFVKLGKRKNTLEVYGVKQFDVGVEGISNELNVYLMDKKYIYNVVSDEDIKPIPLTEEWLLKFGFYKDEEYWWIGRIDCKYCFKYRDWADNWAFYIEYTDGRPSDDGVKYPVAFDIKYVHQLQNLYFALTGEELILNI